MSMRIDFPHTAYLWPAAMIDTAPPTSPTSPTPPTAIAPATEDIRVPKGTAVVDHAGDDIGVVDDLRLDPHNGQLLGFVVRLGGALRTLFGGGEIAEVTRSQVDGVDQDGVHLRLTKEELERVTRDRTR